MINPVSKKHALLFNRQQGAVSLSLIAYLLIGLGLIMVAWTMLTAGLSTKVSLIGQGKPVIAIFYSSHHDESVNLKESFKQLREEYSETVEFVKIDVRSPNGINFNQHTPIQPGIALYFNGAGEQIYTLHAPQEVAAITESIKHNFGI